MSGCEIGVVVVAYNSGDVIVDCISSLIATGDDGLHIVVVDNASPDDGVALIHEWAVRVGVALEERTVDPAEPGAPDPVAKVSLLRCAENLGFAGGVNVGLRALGALTTVELFWVLNPDCVVDAGAPAAYRRKAREVGQFGLMSGRTLYCDPPNCVQSDGARVSRLTGVCSNINSGMAADLTSMPAPDRIDYFIGANVVATRKHLLEVGLMPELYFLFYEEVEWAVRRGNLPLATCPDAIVRHHAGTSIGSGKPERPPSPFANYFNFRNRIWFVRRNYPISLPTAYIFSLLKMIQMVLKRDLAGALAAFCGVHGFSPSANIRNQLSAESAARAFDPAWPPATGRKND